VDSCVVPGAQGPVSADYLEKIGVDASAVKAVVASHWHDDHVKGMSDLGLA
jgi:metal-dependent hydrolase (beta-lactamase superfamily II)